MEIFEKIKDEVKQKLSGINSCHEWEHTERVYNLAMRIGKKENADLEILGLAAILHDIARKEQDESNGKVCHAEKGAILAREILEKYNIPAEKTGNICHCIETHRFRDNNNPKTLEAKILYDSDKLDAIGATGVARAFSFAGHIGAKVHDKNVILEDKAEYTQDDTAFREFLVKLRYLKDKMLTCEGRRVAQERHSFMEKFFDRLNKEVDGET